ncbi:MAG TPA: gas vesicle protein K [Vicinamibacterales bacterium]|nr:gas vesicle protein K [Vicinamibacterales bacterium]
MSPRRKKPSRRRPAAGTRRKTPRTTRRVDVVAPDVQKLRKELDRAAGAPRWNADPEDVRRSVVKLVLTLVELLRKLMERQAIRRMEQGTLTDDETEKLGLSLMRLEETIREIGEQFDLKPEDLNMDLGPVGKLM